MSDDEEPFIPLEFTISFDLDEAPNIGDKYEIEVRPCK